MINWNVLKIEKDLNKNIEIKTIQKGISFKVISLPAACFIYHRRIMQAAFA